MSDDLHAETEPDLSFPTFEPTNAVPKRRDYLEAHLTELQELADDAMKNGAVEEELGILSDLVKYTFRDKNKRGMLGAYYDRLVYLRQRLGKMQQRQEFQKQRIKLIRLQRHCLQIITEVLYFFDPIRREGPPSVRERKRQAAEAKAAKAAEKAAAPAEAPTETRDWSQVDDSELEESIPEEQR